MRSRQLGLSGGLVATILLIIAGVFIAAQVVTRVLVSSSGDARLQGQFSAVHTALEQFVAAQQRIPCPANPTLDTGDEVPTATGSATCSFPEGTLPWKTIGLARADAIDVWGQKISYRVYTGTAGSLTQWDPTQADPTLRAGGTTMIHCDTVYASPSLVTTVVGSAGGLCRQDTRVTLRSTAPASFLAGKGLSVSDLGTLRTGVAYVLVSHGPSGLGGYTGSGVRREMPAAAEELANTAAAGAINSTLCPAASCFVVKAASASGTDAASAGHFDDVVAYRTIVDLIKAAGVSARDWPEEVTTTTTFNKPTVDAAVGQPVTPGQSVGSVTVSFVGVVASGLNTSGTGQEITYGEVGSYGGLGVAGGGSALVQSSANERLRLDVEKASKFAFTLADFGTYGGTRFLELVDIRFFLAGVQVGTVTRIGVGCTIDGGLASFTVNVGALFDRVELTPLPAFDTNTSTANGITAFYLSEIKTCAAADPTCTTPLSASTPNCSVFTF